MSQKKLQEKSVYAEYDEDGDGIVSDEEEDHEEERKQDHERTSVSDDDAEEEQEEEDDGDHDESHESVESAVDENDENMVKRRTSRRQSCSFVYVAPKYLDSESDIASDSAAENSMTSKSLLVESNH